jgi:hypothetical protein
LDDEKAAVSEILAQLDIKNNLMKNSIGVITCYLEFIENGIVKAICAALPFEVTGINTMSLAVAEDAAQMFLSIMVFTSDDIFFRAALSDTLGAEPGKTIGDMYAAAKKAIPGEPSLALVFSPLLMQLGGDALIQELDAASGGIPLFGALAIDFSTKIRDPRIIFNGETWNDRVAIILLSGNVKPEFSVTSISEEVMLRQKAVITKSAGNILIEVNDMPVMRYFESLGLANDGKFIGTCSQIPLVVDLNDGIKPVTRTILAVLPEGRLICGGAVPENCSLTVGNIEKADVLRITAEAAEALLQEDQDQILLFSCAGRNFALGLDDMAELRIAREKLKDRRFMLAYAGGEICPVKTGDGKLKNRFHNVSFISCSFK